MNIIVDEQESIFIVWRKIMSQITEKIKEELIKRCNSYEAKTGYNYYEYHIKYVVKKYAVLCNIVIKNTLATTKTCFFKYAAVLLYTSMASFNLSIL